jgi:hypothetical protein
MASGIFVASPESALTRLVRLGILVLYVAAAGTVFFGVETFTAAHIEGQAPHAAPTTGGIWVLDRLIFGIVVAAILRDDFSEFIRSWKHPASRPKGIFRLVGQVLLAMVVLGASVMLVGELTRYLSAV